MMQQQQQQISSTRYDRTWWISYQARKCRFLNLSSHQTEEIGFFLHHVNFRSIEATLNGLSLHFHFGDVLLHAIDTKYLYNCGNQIRSAFKQMSLIFDQQIREYVMRSLFAKTSAHSNFCLTSAAVSPSWTGERESIDTSSLIILPASFAFENKDDPESTKS